MATHLMLFSVSLFLTGIAYQIKDYVWCFIAGSATAVNLGIAIYMANGN